MGQEQGAYIDGDSGSDFTYGYGGGGDEYSIDLSSGSGLVDFGDADFHYGYGFDTGAEYGDSGYTPGGDREGAYLEYWLEQGLDFETASEFAAEDAALESLHSFTEAQAPLPDVSWPTGISMTPFVDPFQWVNPYTPIFPDLPVPLPPIVTPTIPFTVPAPPQVPMPTTPRGGPIPIAPGLPPACPTGQYHPFPIGHPEQNKCVPFPPMQPARPSPTQPPRSTPATGSTGTGGGSTQKPPTPTQKPPQQQQCPSGYYRDPATGQCKPIPSNQPQSCPTGYYRASNGQCLPIQRCTTPGTVFDAARGICVPQGQALSPVSEDGVFGDLFDNLKELPWWIWFALGGLILLSRDEDGKKTTVTYRRAH